MAAQTNQRFESLDGYRFYAAMAIMVFHIDDVFRLGLERWLPGLQQFPLGVDFFFLLSGFVITARYHAALDSLTGYAGFLKARLARIYPLHLLTIAIAIVLALAGAMLNAVYPTRTDVADLAYALTLTQAWGVRGYHIFNAGAWSLSAEWFVYLLTPLLLLTARRLPLVASIGAVFAYLWLFQLVRTGEGLGSWTQATCWFGMLRAVPTFFAGMLLNRWLAGAGAAWKVGWATHHACFAVTLFCFVTGLLGNWLILLFIATLATAVLAERSESRSYLQGAMMKHLGDASFGIYMLHQLVMTPFSWALNGQNLLPSQPQLSWPGLFALLTISALTLALAWASHRWFEVPAQSRIRAWSSAPRPGLSLAQPR